ncbi:nuclear transport factor 2 family protein [candidate division KSB1 bacterium]
MFSCGKVDPEAERVQIDIVHSELIATKETHDPALLSKVYAHDDDMVVLGTDDVERWIGWENYKNVYDQMFESFKNVDFSVSDQIIKIHESGKVAWFSEIIDASIESQGEITKIEGLRYTGVFEKRDGVWKVVQAHISSPVRGQIVKY